MKVSFRKLVVVILAGLILLPVAAYWLADSWLESSGGRRMLEQALSARIGMSVRLEGEFDLMLLPAIGVAGTELVIGDPGQETVSELPFNSVERSRLPPKAGAGKRDSVFARSREYEISVALRPLVDRKVLVEWIRLTGGHIYPERYPRSNPNNDTDRTVGADSSANLSLPEIQELTIQDFQIVLPPEVEGGDENQLQIKELTLTGFAENHETPFTLEITDLATAGGTLRWDTSQSLIHLGNLEIDLGGQLVSGAACLFLQSPASLHLVLQAGAFDLDALRESLPGNGAGAGQGSGDLPLEIRGRFTVDELKTSGALARGVVLSLGDEPACD